MDHQSKIKAQRLKLAAKIVSQEYPHPLRVGVDGVTASGKTTFADELARLIVDMGRPVVRASIDGFHNPKNVRYRNGDSSPEGYYDDSFNYPTLRTALLEPIRDIVSQSRDLRTAAYSFREEKEVNDQWATFDSATILLFDGVMLFREEINDCWDFRIYIDTRLETAFTRGVPRDAATDEEQMSVGKKYLERYFPGQRIYQARSNPREMADVVVLNNDLNRSHILHRKP